jgi:hypothetical protein
MFCPKCGTEKTDDKKFCDQCGTPLFKRVPADTQNNTQIKTVYAPTLGWIVLGILIIVGMYLIPIPGNNTIAKTAEICGSQYTRMFFGCNNVLFVAFYVGWAFAILLILAGIFDKNFR